AVLAVMLLMFILGFFLDTFEIIFIVVPITAPVLIMLGVDPIWLGVIMGVNLQTSFLTPPFGFALFYLRGVAAKFVSTVAIYRGVIPFVAIQIVAMGILWSFPQLATWLPGVVFGTNVPIERPAGEAPSQSLEDMLKGTTDTLTPAGQDNLMDPASQFK
ncbi:MAG: TRAP transporter large permease subunit, partial [Alphaproteobacteria bacterium]|nr:TRAP transporter large permease subunit [Alphaproteobacteria bacterium]